MLITLIDQRKLIPLWVVPFPRQDSDPGQRVLAGVRMEKQS